MKHVSKLLLALVLATTVASSFPVSSHAQKDPMARPQAAGIGGPTEQHWWGAGAAMGCGLGIRASAIFPGAVLPTAAFCIIALIDALS